MALPASVAIPTSENYLGLQNILKPEIKATLYEKRPSDYEDFMAILELTGREIPVGRDVYSHDENGALFSSFMVTSSAGAATSKTYTLDVSSVETVASKFFSAPRRGFIIQFPTGEQGYINAVSQPTGSNVHTFTANTLDGTNLPALATAGTVFFVGNTEHRGADLADTTSTSGFQPSRSVPRRYDNQIQYFWNNYETLGRDVQTTWTKQPDGKGGMKDVWQFYDSYRSYLTAHSLVAQSLLIGKKTSSSAIDSFTGQSIQTTEGLVPYVKNNGGGYMQYASGSLSYQFFAQMVKYLNKYNGAYENFAFQGIDAGLETDAWISDAMKNGAVSYGAFQGSKEKSVNFAFSSFEIAGFTFHKKTMRTFSNPTAMGSDGQQYPGMMVIVPTDTKKVDDRDQPSISVRYLSKDNFDYSLNDYIVGGAAGNTIKTNGKDTMTRIIRMYKGLECIGAERFIVAERA